ncbi:response regulator transcription factor [Intrasporangium flavum]|uniref:response regulator transcription factor n=1 Tax=Intrasporangium flavum TaxID=1428657 RepID=UPI00096D43D1|nr:response regulator transcription factor [Intrasporangium flavum]
MATHVLLVEDDPDIAPTLVIALEREGHLVTHAPTGAAALAHASTAPTDVVLLDLGLPDMDGLEVCRRLRSGGYTGAVLILTARGGELDRVVGLDVGADDYLSKPFSLSELLARIRATLRRGWAVGSPRDDASRASTASGADASPTGPLGGAANGTSGSPAGTADAAADALSVDTRSRRAFVGGGEIALTAKEFDVLALLDAERGAVITREALMSEVWDENWFGSTKTLDATVGRLRQKLETADSAARISTVRGVGFRLEDEPPDA